MAPFIAICRSSLLSRVKVEPYSKCPIKEIRQRASLMLTSKRSDSLRHQRIFAGVSKSVMCGRGKEWTITFFFWYSLIKLRRIIPTVGIFFFPFSHYGNFFVILRKNCHKGEFSLFWKCNWVDSISDTDSLDWGITAFRILIVKIPFTL